ncbi:MAG: ATP-binding protein [Synergistaceae bacterium]|nr:ATP-binding protein [Synergistaceae bacterium]
MFMFICGPHASGKTSILRALERDNVITGCGYEIGKELFYQDNFDPDKRDEAFEVGLTKMELQRDIKFSNLPGVSVSETWHPGNLAYVAVRNPKSFKRLSALMRTSPLIETAWGIKLLTTPEQMHERTKTFSDNKDWAVDFHSRVGEKIDDCLYELGLMARTVTVDTSDGLELTIRKVKDIIIDRCMN